MSPAALQVIEAKVFVSGLKIDAEIGVHPHEMGRRQPLVCHVEMVVTPPPHGWRGIQDTVNYERVAAAAREIAGAGHIALVETFAWRLAAACLSEQIVRRVTVRVAKPEALAPAAEAAGVEVTLERS